MTRVIEKIGPNWFKLTRPDGTFVYIDKNGKFIPTGGMRILKRGRS
jgi:hypothetical protein